MTKKERAAYQLGLKNAADLLRLFIMPECTKAYHDDEQTGQRQLNKDYEEIAAKMETLEPEFFDKFREYK